MDKILAGARLGESEYDELLQYLLEDAGLAEATGKRPQLTFSDVTTSAFESSITKPRLVRIFNMQKVNALVPGQTLTFGSALTTIFGANASGKSGYARVLGCAGFTRGDKEVLPDITQSSDGTTILTADIEISDGIRNTVINYQVGDPCPELGPFYVFDSTSVHVHLTGSNAFSFSPAGLSCLTQLADVTDKARERLSARIQERAQPYDFGRLFQGRSAVTDLVAKLGPETRLDELRQLAKLTRNEKDRIKEIDIEIAKLKTKKIPEQIRKLAQTIEDLQHLTKRLGERAKHLSDDALTYTQKLVRAYLERKQAVQHISVDQFKSEHFTQTGTNLWYDFIRAAMALAEAEETPGKPYPQSDDHCLLCQQALSPNAQKLLLRLWELLRGEAQAKVEHVRSLLTQKRSQFDAIDLNFFDDQSVSYRHLQNHAVELQRRVTAFIEACRQRRDVALRMIDLYTEESIPPMPDSPVPSIDRIIKGLKEQCEALEKQNPEKQIGKMEEELLGLRHRELLGQHLPEIENYVQRCIWAEKAASIGGSTRHITLKYNQLFAQLVTNRYIELFEKTLRDLRRPLRVKVRTAGRKGETYKQIVLETHPTAPVQDATPDKVLSEGEKRVVALADFVTEVALDTTSSGIIMDDPVTSLDLEWKEVIASILATEAKHRQVIVFTHDLPFLYFLKSHAQHNEVDMATHWIKRGEKDDKPGYVFLNNSPALERDYRTSEKAREFYKRAKDASAAEQENLLRQGFGALRTAYEAFIMFDLFNEVVTRFEERVSFGRLKGVVWDKTIAEEVVKKCELLSRYIEGHLHSNSLLAQKPTCSELISEIEAFDALKGALKKLKKP